MHRLILILIAFFFCKYSYAQMGTVRLQIENIHIKRGGDISAGIFNSKNFLKIGRQLASAEQKVSAAKIIFLFENLTPGEYAFVAYQDIDQNKTMKTNIVGYPKEPWGISNNPTILFGPPSFEESKVKVIANQTTAVNIRLK